MQVEALPASPPAGDTLGLDPFAFVPAWRSRIVGFGGDEPATDPSYVFHTAYVHCNDGPAVFTVHFADLAATGGTLLLSVNALPQRRRGRAFLVDSVQIPVPEAAAAGGEATISFNAERGATYALVGNIHGESDAAAHAINVTLRRGSNMNQHVEQLITARRTVFGARSVRSVARVIVPGAATLADPVSQMCTAAQFDEPEYGEWLDRMHAGFIRHRKQWEFVYILQVLRHYGMLQPGKRGLGFGVGVEPLPAVMAAMGCTVVGTDLPADHQDVADWSLTNQHGMGVDNLRYPDICPNDLFDERVSFRPVDMTAPPADLAGFDFTWSSCAYEHLGSIPAGLRFVEDSVLCLKPGGIAVHTTEFNLSSNDRTVDKGSTVLFRRKDIERLALTLISRGHEVMPIKYDQGDLPLDMHVDVPPYREHDHLKIALSEFVTTSFGIVVRRGPA